MHSLPLSLQVGGGAEGDSRGMLRIWRWITVTFLILAAAYKDVRVRACARVCVWHTHTHTHGLLQPGRA